MKKQIKDVLKMCIKSCINTYEGKYGKVDRSMFKKYKKYSVENVEFEIGEYKNSTLVISFKGSSGSEDWKDNFKFNRKSVKLNKLEVPYKGTDSNIKVHNGFIGQYRLIKSMLNGIVKQQKFCKICNVIITGHSLGAALATIAAIDIKYMFPNVPVVCVLFGSPRVGNRAFAKSFNKYVKTCYNIINEEDAITKLPPWTFGYKRVKTVLNIGHVPWWKYVINPMLKITGDILEHYPEKYEANVDIL